MPSPGQRAPSGMLVARRRHPTHGGGCQGGSEQCGLHRGCPCRAGVYTNSYDALLNMRNGFPVFTTVLEANYVAKQEDRFAAFKLTDEDRAGAAPPRARPPHRCAAPEPAHESPQSQRAAELPMPTPRTAASGAHARACLKLPAFLIAPG